MYRMPVFYRPEQVALNADSYSPSAGKPALVVADWLADPELAPLFEVHSFEPAGRTLLNRVHTRRYIDGVLGLEIDNGFGNRDAEVAASLPFTVGSMVAAARHAATTRRHACSPSSGFHHAHPGHGDGFCTFNGLMVAAHVALASGCRKVGILDLDHHYADGTVAVLANDPGLGPLIVHATAGEHYCYAWRDGPHPFFRWIQSEMRAMSKAGCDLILYQAGADQHRDDPLGGFLDDQGMAERYRLVFDLAKRYRLPVAWNLAGGYRKDAAGTISPVLHTHRETLRAALGVSTAWPIAAGEVSGSEGELSV